MMLTLRLAWRNLWRHPRRTWLTTGAMIFCNVILVFMLSMQLAMYGMMIDNTVRASTGHIQVQAPGYLENQKIRETVPDVGGLAATLGKDLDTKAVAPRASAFALLSSADRSFGVQVLGVDPRQERQVSSLPGLIKKGHYLDGLGTAEVVIGKMLADNLKTHVGDQLTLLGSGRDGSFAAAVLTVVGILDTGNTEMDRGLAEIPLTFFQQTFSMGTSGHEVVVMAPSLLQVASLQQRIEALLPSKTHLVVLDWEQLIPGLKQAIQADLSSGLFMYAILIVLVAFSVLNTQLMSVLERTKEFGIVLALGVSPGRLGRLVLIESALMGALGLALGVLLGGSLVLWFSFHGLTFPGLEEMAGRFNMPDRVFLHVSPIGLFLGPSIVYCASLLATVYPMVKLYRIEPVTAMRAA